MINSFKDEYAFLSNFWPCEVSHDGKIYPSSEHAFQAAKTLDPLKKIPFTSLMVTAGQSKRMGRKLELRPNWDNIKIAIMEEIVLNKFFHNHDIREKLFHTHPQILIEGNTWHDTFWGVCDDVGENHLGHILMRVRSELLFPGGGIE